jgi:hypothetical protein
MPCLPSTSSGADELGAIDEVLAGRGRGRPGAIELTGSPGSARRGSYASWPPARRRPAAHFGRFCVGAGTPARTLPQPSRRPRPSRVACRGQAAAEPLYRQSLEIDERIGNQAGVATSYAALGGSSETLGTLTRRSPTGWGALAIRLEIGTVTAGDARALTGLRRQLGRDRFWSAALASGLGEQSAASLMEMLDQQGPTAGN